jgi:hypothetical protein
MIETVSDRGPVGCAHSNATEKFGVFAKLMRQVTGDKHANDAFPDTKRMFSREIRTTQRTSSVGFENLPERKLLVFFDELYSEFNARWITRCDAVDHLLHNRVHPARAAVHVFQRSEISGLAYVKSSSVRSVSISNSVERPSSCAVVVDYPHCHRRFVQLLEGQQPTSGLSGIGSGHHLRESHPLVLVQQLLDSVVGFRFEVSDAGLMRSPFRLDDDERP